MSIATYRESHYGCEGRCGKPATEIHHVRTRGAGGDDDDENLLALCSECHRGVHDLGWKTWGFMHPWLQTKLAWAHKRARVTK